MIAVFVDPVAHLSLDRCKELLGGWLPAPCLSISSAADREENQLQQARAAVGNRLRRGAISTDDLAPRVEAPDHASPMTWSPMPTGRGGYWTCRCGASFSNPPFTLIQVLKVHHCPPK